ncbi:DMT family transporter [Dehalobacterium formicoaceticum]|uniref:Multidrug efflux SMR transporter n=1 Tax=Dehalobacterium formicoaceticum TaxID=51515 RepID=A0ABT1YAX9_9FIRM|nr:multidrug efflux SMR transporter [Dehalobacterium formicoaceticum]MCR6547089.1 multidrug efflux SMR transporter [Dehalobacterium formicoaceticum]
MGYVYLFLAISLELLGTFLLKYAAGFTKLLPSLGCLIAYGLCFFLFSKALLSINLSVAYATWSAIGIIASVFISIGIFKETINFLGIIGVVLVIAGVILLNVYGTSH